MNHQTVGALNEIAEHQERMDTLRIFAQFNDHLQHCVPKPAGWPTAAAQPRGTEYKIAFGVEETTVTEDVQRQDEEEE